MTHIYHCPSMPIRDHTLNWGSRTYIMGIINMTPDSFSHDGLDKNIDSAVEQAQRFVDAGADLLDIGGESTRPGHQSVSLQEELERVIPLIQRIRLLTDIPISIDTTKVEVVYRALEAGADIINDIWGVELENPRVRCAVETGKPIILMHNRSSRNYLRLIDEIFQEMKTMIDQALSMGLTHQQIIVDPGIGFGKDPEQNTLVLQHLHRFVEFEYPLLLGVSRKSVIGHILNLTVENRLEGTLAANVYGIVQGVDIIRVHDVLEAKRAAVVVDRLLGRK